jgi:CheY-like chemotaxis protein
MTTPPHSNKNILIVDDDFDVRDLLTLVLKSSGYEAVGVANGQEALSHLRRSNPPAVILLDLIMPVMDAWEFRQLQQSDPVLGAIPVVLLSATEEIGEHGKALQAAALIRKPIDFGVLLETVGRYC